MSKQLDRDIVYVFPKPSVLMLEYTTGENLIDFYGDCFDMDAPYPIFKRHGQAYHKYGEPVADWGSLTFKDGPRFGRFVGPVFGTKHCGRFISHSHYLLCTIKDTVSKYVFMMLDDWYCIDSAVCMMYYAHMANISLEKCCVQKYKLLDGLLGSEIPLKDVWEQVKDDVPEEPEGGRREILRLLSLSGMSKREFADYFGIKPRTVENWCYLSGSDAPSWAVPLFELKLETDGKI